MLAKNFKTAEELGLTEKGYVGLLKVLRMLEGGKLVNCRHWPPTRPNEFNMASTWHETECGTVGCIGGWAGFYDDDGIVPGMLLPNAHIGPLFCPPNRLNRTVEQAAHALRTYLVTGTPNWW